MRWLNRVAVVIASAAVGCATPGDPSCAVYDEINDQSCLKRALYHPEFDPVGLQKTTWYNCPTAWSPECPGVDCGYCESPHYSAAAPVVVEQSAIIPPVPESSHNAPVSPAAE